MVKTSTKKTTAAKKKSSKVSNKNSVKATPISKTSKTTGRTKSSSPKKIPSAKSSVQVQKVTKKKGSEKKVSLAPKMIKEEQVVVKEGFQLIRQINDQLDKVAAAKDTLQSDIKRLEKRVAEKESAGLSMKESLFVQFKNEILKDIEPLLQSLNLSAVREEVLKEVSKYFEKEVNKVYSEVSEQGVEARKILKEKIAELEARIVDILKTQKNQKATLENFSEKMFDDALANIMNVMEEKLSVFSSKLISSTAEFQTQQGKLELVIDELKTAKEKSEKELQVLKEQTKKLFGDDATTLSSLEGKVNGLEQSFSSLSSLLERYEHDLYDGWKAHAKDILSQVEGSFAKNDTATKEQMETLKSDTMELVGEYLKGLDKKIEEIEGFSQLAKNHYLDIDKKVLEVENVMKTNAVELQKEDLALKHYLAEKYNEIVDVFADLSLKVQEDVKHTRDEVEAMYSQIENSFEKVIEEKLARGLLTHNENMLRLQTKIREEEKDMREELEKKFFTTKSQFSKSFEDQLKKFDEEMLAKESEFLGKLSIIENEKAQMLGDLEDFKKEIALLTKNYVDELHGELTRIKEEERTFDTTISNVLESLEITAAEKSATLENQTQEEIKKVRAILEEQKNSFIAHENTFKDTFHERVLALQSYFKQKVAQVEQKILEKNVGEAKRLIAPELENLELLSGKIEAKEGQLDLKMNEIEMKEKEYFDNLQAEFKNYQGLVEQQAAKGREFNKKIEEDISKFEAEHKTVLLGQLQELAGERNRVLEEIEKEQKRQLTIFDERLSALDTVYERLENEIFEVGSKMHDIIFSELQDISKEKEKIQELFTKKSQKIDAEMAFMKEKQTQSFMKEIEEISNQRKKAQAELEQIVSSGRTTLLGELQALSVEREKLVDQQHKDKLVQDKHIGESLTKVNQLVLEVERRLGEIQVAQKEIVMEELLNLGKEREKSEHALLKREKEADQKLREKVSHFEDTGKQVLEKVKDQVQTERSRVEERLMGLEKQLNKRFLEMETQVTQFKGLVLDEVESLVKDVEEAVQKKFSELDTHKHAFETAEMSALKSIDDMKKNHAFLEGEYRMVRDDVNDLRIKYQITDAGPNLLDVEELVHHMNSYEEQLVNLVESLKNKGATDKQVFHALISKGHPRVYVQMVLNHYLEAFHGRLADELKWEKPKIAETPKKKK